MGHWVGRHWHDAGRGHHPLKGLEARPEGMHSRRVESCPFHWHGDGWKGVGSLDSSALPACILELALKLTYSIGKWGGWDDKNPAACHSGALASELKLGA